MVSGILEKFGDVDTIKNRMAELERREAAGKLDNKAKAELQQLRIRFNK